MNFKNLIDLIKEAHKYQYADISDSEELIDTKKPILFFTKVQWGLVITAILINIFIKSGYNKEFCGYIISGLSLFTGIFFTFIIALYDSFTNADFSKYYKSNSMENYPLGVRLINYYKKTTVLSIYLILLSIISIILLSCTLLFNSILNQDLDLIRILPNICNESFLFIIKTIGIFVYRLLIFYFLSDFVVITIYLTSSIYDFIIYKYEKVNLEK